MKQDKDFGSRTGVKEEFFTPGKRPLIRIILHKVRIGLRDKLTYS